MRHTINFKYLKDIPEEFKDFDKIYYENYWYCTKEKAQN